MSVRTYVGFVADFPFESSDLDPPGRELAAFVADRLKAAGFSVEEPEDREGWAWEFHTKSDQFEIMSIVGLVDDMESDPPRQWLVTNDCELGLFKRLLGGQTLVAKRDGVLRGLCEELHQIISTDTRFSHIVWYDKGTFDQANDQPGETP